jgi:hypothetical protein
MHVPRHIIFCFPVFLLGQNLLFVSFLFFVPTKLKHFYQIPSNKFTPTIAASFGVHLPFSKPFFHVILKLYYDIKRKYSLWVGSKVGHVVSKIIL